MSARESMLENDRKMSRFDWFRKTKHTLRRRCTQYGLPATGKKADLIDRLCNHTHPSSNPSEDLPRTHPDASSSDDDDLPLSFGKRKQGQPSSSQGAITLEAIRTIIQEELVAKNPPISQAAREEEPLSPTSIISAQVVSSGHLAPQDQHQSNQGLLHNINYSNKPSLLPSLSAKLINDIKNLQFIDFNQLLSSALSEPTPNTNMFFEVNESPVGSQILTLQPSKTHRRRMINTATMWLEAWNTYLRTMAHFHPALIPDLLIYQDFICSLQRSYPVHCWLRYDTAFRLRTALDKTTAWSSIDEQAFNKYVRCSVFQNKIVCFICGSENHLANACSQRSFRPKQASTFPNRSQIRNHQPPPEYAGTSMTQTQNASTLIAVSLTDANRAQETTPATNASALLNLFNPLPDLSPTPININSLSLELSNYPSHLKNSLLQSLTLGFDIGYRGPQFSFYCKNLKSASQYPAPLCANIASELKEKRIAGPFSVPPLPNFRTSPIGIVPKKDSNKFRTITNLSSPDGSSINDFIPASEASVHFNHFDDAVNIVAKLGPGALMAKLDVKSAFRICPVRKHDWNLLGFSFMNFSLWIYVFHSAFVLPSIGFLNSQMRSFGF